MTAILLQLLVFARRQQAFFRLSFCFCLELKRLRLPLQPVDPFALPTTLTACESCERFAVSAPVWQSFCSVVHSCNTSVSSLGPLVHGHPAFAYRLVRKVRPSPIRGGRRFLDVLLGGSQTYLGETAVCASAP